MSQYSERHASALSLLHRGRPAEAERVLRALLQQAHVRDEEYDEWLRTLVETCRALGRTREAGAALVYLGRFSEAYLAFTRDGTDPDGARARELGARAAPPDKAGALWLTAAREYEAEGLPVQAAVAFGNGGAHVEALRLWEKVQRDPRLAVQPYERALVVYNLGLCARRAGRADLADRTLARAQRLLEEVADEYETRGERERAFDCYVLLLHHGRELGSFENLAEGYVNCIRVLKEDNFKFYVLQYYEDFLRLAFERGEYHAAASVCREAADYARRQGMPYDRGYLARSAEAWWLAADENERGGAPVDLTENALLSAVDCWAALSDFERVHRCYERLAALPLAPARRARYHRIALRHRSAVESHGGVDPVPDYLKQQHAYPPIWELDLVEWEGGGDHAAVCLMVAGDRRQPSMIRRRALVVLLAELDGRRAGTAGDPQRLSQVAQGLGDLQAYAALRPLERLFGHADPVVRRGVMRALKRLYFPRTFQLVSRGLRDGDAGVRQAALEAVDALHFTSAFNPLARIYRDSLDPAVKTRALGAIGRIASVEAGELLIEVVRHEPDPMRDTARRLLWNFDNPEIFPILRRHFEAETGPARGDLEQILRAAAR